MPKFPSTSKIKRVVVRSQEGQVHIYYGADPKSENAFDGAAYYLSKRLKRIYKNSKVTINSPKEVNNCADLMNFLMKVRSSNSDKIKELHIFSHAWQSGLSLNYGGSPTAKNLNDLAAIYGNLVRQHIGSDDYKQFNPIQLRVSNFQYLTEDQIKKIRASFISGGIIKLWGCKAGYGSADSNPYTNIAETMAQYANVTAYGSPKGTNFYAFIKGKWTTKFPPVGSRPPWPLELRPYRSRRARQSNKFSPTQSLSALVKNKLIPKTPSIGYADDNFNDISADPSNPQLFKLKSGTTVAFSLVDFEASDKKVTIYNKGGTQIMVNKMMTLMSHPEWKLNSDNKTIELKSGRDSFMGAIHNMSTLTANGLSGDEYYFKVNYTGTGGAKVFEGKKQKFTFS